MKAVLWCLLGFFVFGAICLGIFGLSGADRAAAVAAAQKQEQAAKSRFQLALGGAMKLRKAMRNPSSLDLANAYVADDESAVCYQYHAQNGFGGIDIVRAVLTKTALVNSDDVRFRSLWRENCEGRGPHFYDERDDVMAALREYDKKQN